ncbi:MAG TPA: PTS sugar transporter subunit IIA [Candidatus Aminicenantes bacterium]|nr:PTS sugar transporter subunit IIA [Candidatus Aminicenantes bacterium]
MKLTSILKPDCIKVDCRADSREALLTEMVSELAGMGLVAEDQRVIRKLLERESMGSTAIGNHAAVPHTKVHGLPAPIVFIAISRKGIHYSEADKERVHLAVLILSPTESPIVHLQILAAAASLIKHSRNLIRDILNADTREAVVQIIRRNENQND